MTLFKLTNKIGEWFVIAEHPTEAEQMLKAHLDKADYDFWKLQFKIKWELEISGDEKMEPLKMALVNAFSKLNYEDPEKEANLILLFLDGLASYVLKGSSIDAESMIQFMLKKYNT